jgi:hypothetical protein
MAHRKQRRPKPGGPSEAEPGAGAAPPRPGLPAPETVLSETTLTSPTGRKYRVLRTNQKDEYEQTPPEPGAETARPPHSRPARGKGKRRRKP